MRTAPIQPIRLSPSFRFEGKASAQGRVEGLASPFGGDPDAYGDIIAQGAFSASLAKHKSAGTAPAMLWAHDQARPIGTWDKLTERADGLHVEGTLALSTKDGADAFEHLRAGAVTGLSIGFTVPKNGAEYAQAGRILKAIDLAEVSLVTIPAAQTARVTAVKGAPVMVNSQAELEAMLREGGLSRGAAAQIARGGWPALTRTDTSETIARLAEMLRKAAKEL